MTIKTISSHRLRAFPAYSSFRPLVPSTSNSFPDVISYEGWRNWRVLSRVLTAHLVHVSYWLPRIWKIPYVLVNSLTILTFPAPNISLLQTQTDGRASGTLPKTSYGTRAGTGMHCVENLKIMIFNKPTFDYMELLQYRYSTFGCESWKDWKLILEKLWKR